jgi:DNA ligase 1
MIDDTKLTYISPEIYKRDSLGRVRVWKYEVQDDKWRVHTGILGGKTAASEWTTCQPRSQPTAEAQALFEGEAEMRKKLSVDYRARLDDVDVARASVIKPMLAEKYEAFPGFCYSQPKLDGIRCIATKDGLWTRTGKEIVSCRHVREALEPHFQRHPSLILDGELYNHELRDNFNEIVSVVRKSKPSKIDEAFAETMIQYHIYDVPSIERAFGERQLVLTLMQTSKTIVRVPTQLAVEEESLDDYYADYLAQGYEGQMVRLDARYEQKRSKSLLKRKEFQDAEFKLLRVEEGTGNWSGYAKRAVFALPDGREFGAGVKGDQAFCRNLLGDHERFTHGTVRYFALTPDGVPRFPVAVDFFAGDRA